MNRRKNQDNLKKQARAEMVAVTMPAQTARSKKEAGQMNEAAGLMNEAPQALTGTRTERTPCPKVLGARSLRGHRKEKKEQAEDGDAGDENTDHAQASAEWVDQESEGQKAHPDAGRLGVNRCTQTLGA